MSTSKPQAGHFSILYFASAASFTNKSSDHLVAPMKLSTLLHHLEDMYPTINQRIMHSCALTVNLEYVDMQADADMLINEGDEVAIIPPVSSG
jgi:molybdopterin converting factor small subunit